MPPSDPPSLRLTGGSSPWFPGVSGPRGLKYENTCVYMKQTMPKTNTWRRELQKTKNQRQTHGDTNWHMKTLLSGIQFRNCSITQKTTRINHKHMLHDNTFCSLPDRLTDLKLLLPGLSVDPASLPLHQRQPPFCNDLRMQLREPHRQPVHAPPPERDPHQRHGPDERAESVRTGLTTV